MTGTERDQSLRSLPGRRSWPLLVLVVLLSCGVIAMHSLGAGHIGLGHFLGHDPGPAMAAGQPAEGRAPESAVGPSRAGTAAHAVPGSTAGTLTTDHQIVTRSEWGCQECAVNAAPPLEQTGGHGGLAMCLAVLSLLVWVVLRRQRRPFRMVRTLGGAGRRAFTGLLRGPPSCRTPSLSKLCICRT
ncbi:MAG: hypothetical protein ABI112_09405 [Terracoccus sp.]